MSEPIPVLEPQRFEMPGDRGAKWDVTLMENGSLRIFACGRASGVIHIEPHANNSIVITTDRLTREGRQSLS